MPPPSYLLLARIQQIQKRILDIACLLLGSLQLGLSLQESLLNESFSKLRVPLHHDALGTLAV
jgi:hypothetical protein